MEPESFAVGHYQEPTDNIHDHTSPEDEEEKFVDSCEVDEDVGDSYTNWSES